jgi:cytochrome c553
MTAAARYIGRLAPLALLLTAAAVAAQEAANETDQGDVARGLEASKICVACHGERGISTKDNYPHLHGQHRTYLLREMRAFRDGVRQDPIMTPMLGTLSDQDLQDIAAYYASFNTILGSETPIAPMSQAPMPTPQATGVQAATKPASEAAVATAPSDAAAGADATLASATGTADVDAGKQKAFRCRACHGADGRGTTPLHPNLNGQHAEYLAAQLRAFRDGSRQDPIMTNLARPLSDQDIADIAAFYAAQP